MQPLKLNQKFLTLVNLCAPPDDVTRSQALLHTVLGVYIFVTLCLDLISSSFFLIQYKKRDLEDVLGSILQIAAVSSNIFGMVAVFPLAKRLRNIFSLYQKIYNDCNYPHKSIFLRPIKNKIVDMFCISKGVHDESCRIFIKINQLCEKVTRILVIKYVLGYYVLSITLAMVNVTFCYIKNGDGIDTLCLYTPYKHM